MRTHLILLLLLLSASSAAAHPRRSPVWHTRVIAEGLAAPTGIALGRHGALYFTEVPTPGVPGREGGLNAVKRLWLHSGHIETISDGEPEPVNLALSRDGDLYWTCRTAGVILWRPRGGDVQLFLAGLAQPTGLAVDTCDNVWFTELPTPGVPGGEGGTNEVSRFDGDDVETLTVGEPEPTDIVVAPDGTAYWTCRSANVILRRTPDGVVSRLLGDLDAPVGIALDRRRDVLYFTEVPTPGVSGDDGGRNAVRAYDLRSGRLHTVDRGDPEPTDIAVGRDGSLYWTCTAAGVIVQATRRR